MASRREWACHRVLLACFAHERRAMAVERIQRHTISVLLLAW